MSRPASSVKKLIENINKLTPFLDEKKKVRQLKKIQGLVQKVLKKHKTLDLIVQNDYKRVTPLHAAIASRSLAAFKMLVALGASPFFKPDNESESVVETLANNWFNPFGGDPTEQIFKWLQSDKKSPVYTWSKLEKNKVLFEKFKKAALIPEKKHLNYLPIHAAIKAGRMDLVDDIIKQAGSLQAAGDLPRMSVLDDAISAACKGNQNALKILRNLLQKGADIKQTGSHNRPVIMLAVQAGLLSDKVNEDDIFNVVKLLKEHGASLGAVNPNNGLTPLMVAMERGYSKLFDYLLEQSSVKAINKTAFDKKSLAFKLFDRNANRLETVKTMKKLKDKGLRFDQTIGMNNPTHRFDDSVISEKKVTASNMSLLHFYVSEQLAGYHFGINPLDELDKHIEMIQTLTASGTNPNVRAIFTIKEKKRDNSNKPQQVTSTIELSAAEYARWLIQKIISGRSHDYNIGAYVNKIKKHKDESEFLKSLPSYMKKKEKIKIHKMFHQFRNLERVLSGQKVLPYVGFPKIKKFAKPVELQQKSTGSELLIKKQKSSPNLVSSGERKVSNETKQSLAKQYLDKLTAARWKLEKHDWKTIKAKVIDHVKSAMSLEEFLERVTEFKESLQLHYNESVSSNDDVKRGSMMYRLFHVFDANKLPGSWEAVRKFGNARFGVDINENNLQNGCFNGCG
jgi:ankyrin repeat protein